VKSWNVDILASRYRAMLGAGGIGSGVFFALDGNDTLGREESRSGHFIDRRDYCKLHIISHYVKILLGQAFQVLPIGKVGADEAGQRLLKEMEAAGLDLRHIQAILGAQTLYSFCLLYPDGSGGNLTTDNSACDQLTEEDVSRAEADFAHFRSAGIALAAPEVPLAARRRLLQLGSKYDFWRVAALTSAEIPPAFDMSLFTEIDLLALNRDETAAVAQSGVRGESASFLLIMEEALDRLSTINPGLQVIITAGMDGSWSWDGRKIQHVPALPVEAASAAGAGDALLAGAIAGKVAGLDLVEAQELGTLVAAQAVTSPHTIDPQLDRQSLWSLANQFQFALTDRVEKILQED
jgi:ribokinase